jgi:hypothetical protein
MNAGHMSADLHEAVDAAAAAISRAARMVLSVRIATKIRSL